LRKKLEAAGLSGRISEQNVEIVKVVIEAANREDWTPCSKTRSRSARVSCGRFATVASCTSAFIKSGWKP
jgi:hypothetical protein